MPIEARDRLVSLVDHATVFAQRHILGILPDDPDTPNPTNLAAPRRPITTGVAETARGRGGNVLRTDLFTARRNAARGRRLQKAPLTIGRENTLWMSGGWVGRGSGPASVLPAWYPRTPLRDITAVVRTFNQAVERRRARLREDDQETEIAPLQDHGEHGISVISLNTTAGVTPRPCPVRKVSKIILDITNQTAGDSEFLTPQKKLLNSIDTVRKDLMKELQKLERMPMAKQAAKEKRFRTLMSMR